MQAKRFQILAEKYRPRKKFPLSSEYRPPHIFEFTDLVKFLIKEGFSIRPAEIIYDANWQSTGLCSLWKARLWKDRGPDQIIDIHFISSEDTVIRILQSMSK